MALAGWGQHADAEHCLGPHETPERRTAPAEIRPDYRTSHRYLEEDWDDAVDEAFDADQDVPGRTVTEYLAQTLDLSVADFVEAFGAGWQPLPDDGSNLDSDPSGMGNIFGPWYVAGKPFQLALRPRGDRVELGIPVGRWIGDHRVHWESHFRQALDSSSLLQSAPTVVANLLKRRRSQFRYCRYCRQLTPPEERSEPDVCYGCSTTWQGVIY